MHICSFVNAYLHFLFYFFRKGRNIIIMTENSLGERMKELRKKHSLSQNEFSKICQKDATTVGRYEKGTLPVPSDVLINIIENLNVSPEWLLLGTTEANYKSINSKIITDLVTPFQSLTIENQKDAIDYINFRLTKQKESSPK